MKRFLSFLLAAVMASSLLVLPAGAADVVRFSDVTDRNTIIYGHNMMNGTMFAGLQGYVQKDFCEQHPIIEFQTADGCAGYQVFAVAWVKSNDDWYKIVNLDSTEDFNSAVERIIGKALFQVVSRPEFGTQILTLSTCYDSAHNGRLLVLAAKL